jgi:hypothetical protein
LEKDNHVKGLILGVGGKLLIVMNKYVLLTVAALGCMIIGCTANELTNQLTIGGKAVASKVVDGKIVGDRWMVVSNELIRIHVEATPIPGPPDASKEDSSAKDDSEPSLRLLLSTGVGPIEFGHVKGLHGLIYMADDLRTPALAKTNKVDIFSSDDNARIVVMLVDNGPIYSSTNSGMTWVTINAPGNYEFPLTVETNGGGFKAAATIHPSSKNQTVTHLPPRNWYAFGSAPDGSGLILTKNASQAAPALNITRSSSGAVVSWPSAFTGFVLQASDGLSATNWVNVPNPVKTVGQENQVFVPSQAGNGFYRLRSK